MKKTFLAQSLLSVLVVLFLFGCAVKAPVDLPSFSAKSFDMNMYESKVDNFLIVLDASSSMRDKCTADNIPKFVEAKAVAERMNLSIPELGQMAGLRSFGHDKSVCKKHTKLFYGMENYATAELDEKLQMITQAGGTSPMNKALDAVAQDLSGLSGDHAVILISDGLSVKNAVEAAQNLKDTYGTSICIYPIQVGQSPEGEAVLREMARIGDCGFYSTAHELMTSDGMADFIEKVFLKAKEAVVRKPAPKPVPPPMVVKGERKDTDGDGVYDDEDRCPGTPIGAKVNAVGCWVLDNILFDFDKDVIKPEGYAKLNAVADILKKNPAMSVELQGHTDNVGTEEYNMDLSMRRSNAVAKYLVDKGILRNRLATTGFGYKQPVALNGTDFGRSLNRRVEIHPY